MGLRQDAFDGTAVTRNGVTEFSTWAVDGLLPFAVSDAAGTLQDTPVTVAVLGHDIDHVGNGLKVASIMRPPVYGVASISTDQQTIIYTPIVTPTQKTNQRPGGLRFGNLEFDLSLFVDNAPQHGVHKRSCCYPD